MSSPANVPTETTTTEAAPVVNGEKKDLKTDKRKSSFPFAFGKKAGEGAATTPEGEATSPSEEKKGNTFSKLRATIKVRPYSSFGVLQREVLLRC